MDKHISKCIANVDNIIDRMNADNAAAIIADIKHWCEHNGIDFDEQVDIAQYYYEDEVENSKKTA
ncbi:MAG: hypothetical protein LC650_05285 [Actinobacteria bacterium]|nr:hypothetical protein [Actinomycetota bacterium]